MKKEWVVTLTNEERQDRQKTCDHIRTLLHSFAYKIDDKAERDAFWDQTIKQFNKVAETFTE